MTPKKRRHIKKMLIPTGEREMAGTSMRIPASDVDAALHAIGLDEERIRDFWRGLRTKKMIAEETTTSKP